MERADLDAVCRTFVRVFRGVDKKPSAELKRYFATLVFDNPSYCPEQGAVVHVDLNGRVDGALTALPMTYSWSGG